MLTIFPNFTIKNNYKKSSPDLCCKKSNINYISNSNNTDSFNFKGFAPEPQNKAAILKIAKLIRQQCRIAILTHSPLDVDAGASMLALKKIIEHALGKTVDVFTMHKLPSCFRFIDPKQEIKIISEESQYKDLSAIEIINAIVDEHKLYDLAISVDVAERSLMDPILRAAIFNPAEHTVAIDHHPVEISRNFGERDCYDFSDITLRDSTADSATQLIMQLIKALGLKEIPKDISDLIMSGMLSDTRCHQGRHNSPIFLNDLLLLQKNGGDYNNIIAELNKRTPEQIKIAGKIFNEGCQSSCTKNNARITYFTVDQRSLGEETREICNMVFDEIGKTDAKYSFCIIENSPEAHMLALIRSNDENGHSLRSIIKQEDELTGGGHDHACVARSKKLGKEQMKELILKRLIALDQS